VKIITGGVSITCPHCNYEVEITRKTYMVICPNCRKGVKVESSNDPSFTFDPVIESLREWLNKPYNGRASKKVK